MIQSVVALLGVISLLAWHQGQALPRFTRTLQLEPTADTSANVSVGDVNGDGHLDLVLIKGRHWPGMSRVLFGDGQGRYSGARNLTDTRYRSYSGNLVDLDGDGSLDVILSNDAPDPKVILRNDGKGNYRSGGTFGRPEWETRNVAVADLNGDRLPDIVVANRSDHATLFVCLNHGAGRFDTTCSPFADYSATTITPVDMNGDGRIDLVVPNRDGGRGFVYLNAGDATFPKEKRIPFGTPAATVRMAAVSDLDKDGALDIVTIDDEHRKVEISYGIRSGGFAAPIAIGDGKAEPYALTVGDLNRDGRPDLVVGFVEAPSAVFFGEGTRRFTTVSFGDGKGAVYGFAIADLDSDGHLDIVAARSEAPNILYFGDVK